MSHPCSDPWSTLVLSPAENRVTACCEYSAMGAALVDGAGKPARIEDLWNSRHLQDMRRTQAGLTPSPHGCGGCAQSYDSPSQLAPFALLEGMTLNPAQAENLARLRRDWSAKTLISHGLPARYVIFFGWGCNIRCRICNQVPHRDDFRSKLPLEAFEMWRRDMALAAEVECLGGEPFAIPAGLAFMKAFVAADDLAHVPMRITSNATLLHRHFDWLADKERIFFNISIDSVGEGYEDIRAGGHWETVSANLREIRRRMASDRPHWRLTTNALHTKTGLAHLPDFARFHVNEDIHTTFNALRPTRGIEEMIYAEDLVHFPHLVDQVPQGWAKLDEAIAIFRAGGFAGEAAMLDSLRHSLRTNNRPAPRDLGEARILAKVQGADVARMVVGNLGPGKPDLVHSHGGLGFTALSNDQGMVLGVNFQGTLPEDGRVGLRLRWEALDGEREESCRAVIYDQPDFFLLSWTETPGTHGGLSKQLDVCALGDFTQPKRLLVSLMAAGRSRFNRLPDSVELLA